MDQKKPNQNRGSKKNTTVDLRQEKPVLFKVRKGWLGGMAILLCCLVMIVAGGCFGGSTQENSKTAADESMVSDQASGETANAVPVPEATANASTPFDTSKIIYSGNISMNTEDYQNSFEKISSYAVELGGFVQDSGSNYASEQAGVQANSGYLTIRVPSDKFSEAMTQIQSWGSPISANVSSSNISQQYQDVQAQLNNLRIEEGRLLDYLKQATNITDMLAIESELNRVRTEIDSLTTTIKNWDTEMAYSTIYVSLYEKRLSSTAVNSPFSEIFTKIGEGFVTSLNLLLYIISFLIVLIFRLIPFAALAGLGFFIFIKVRKKNKDKKNKSGKSKPDKTEDEKTENKI
jgi:virulence-associated protein VapD